MCKCENCKNGECDSGTKKPQSSLGSVSTHGKTIRKLESPQTIEREVGQKISSRKHLGADDEGVEGSEDENEDEDNSKERLYLRKQLFANDKNSFALSTIGQTPPSFKIKADEILDEEFEDPKYKTDKKLKERKKKVHFDSNAPPKTPTSFSETQKKILDYTPSPDKLSFSGGRSRRNVRPFGHINPEEYELGK